MQCGICLQGFCLFNKKKPGNRLQHTAQERVIVSLVWWTCERKLAESSKILCFPVSDLVCSSLNVALTPFVLFIRSQLLSGHLSP